MMGGEEPFTPDLLIEADARDEIEGLMRKEDVKDRAVSLMLHLSRRQMFNDGNKRVAMLAANKVMIAGGAGVISVPPSRIAEFVQCLTDYYRSNDMREAKAFVQEHCVNDNRMDVPAPETGGVADRMKQAEDRKEPPGIPSVPKTPKSPER
jgi:hypothetical protein